MIWLASLPVKKMRYFFSTLTGSKRHLEISLWRTPKSRKTPPTWNLRQVCTRQYVRACKCVCMHITQENGCVWHDCTWVSVPRSVCRSESAAQWVNVAFLLAKHDVLKEVKEWKQTSLQWAERPRNWFLYTFPRSKYSKMVPASPCANVLVLQDAGEPEGFHTTRQKY